MKKTANYGLNLWEKTDRIQMEDFNADNAKIEAALELLSADKFYLGSWTGDGTANRTIQLPFEPKFILVLGSQYVSNTTKALITFATQDTQRYIDSSGAYIGSSDLGGVLSGASFKLGQYPAYHNYKGHKIYYLALK